MVRLPSGEARSFPGGRTPSLSGIYLAYADDNGIRVVRWRTGEQVSRDCRPASKPALAWPWLAYRFDVFDGQKELWLRNLERRVRPCSWLRSGRTRISAGRPSSGARVAWHVATSKGSSIGLYEIGSGARRILARSKISLLSSPSLSDSRVVWVDQRGGRARLRLRRLDRGGATTLVASGDRDDCLLDDRPRGPERAT